MDFIDCRRLSSTIINRCLLFSDKIVVAHEEEHNPNGLLAHQRDGLLILHRKDGEIEVDFRFDLSKITADDVIRNISKYSPNVKYVGILTALNVRSFPSIDTTKCSSIEDLTLGAFAVELGKMTKDNLEELQLVSHCLPKIDIVHTRVVDAVGEIKMLTQCFPNLKRVSIISNSISFDLCSEWEWTNTSIKQIFFQNCSSINFVELIVFVRSCLPSAADICLIECNISMNEDDIQSCKTFLIRILQLSAERRNINKLSFQSCSGVLNIGDIVMVNRVLNRVLVYNLEISNSAVRFSDEDMTPISRLDSLSLWNCQFPPECIHVAIRRCDKVSIIRNGIQVQFVDKTVALLSKLPVCMNPPGGNLLIGLEDFRNALKWCPNMNTLGIYSPLNDFTSSAMKDLRIDTAVKIMIFFWNNMRENRQLINFMSTCCPNMYVMMIHDCNISFDVPIPGSHTGIIWVILRNCHGMKISNLIKFLKSTCPSVKFIDIQNCRSAFHSSGQTGPKITMPKLQRMSIINTEMPVDITQVFLSLQNTLGLIPELLIKNSYVTFSPNTAISGNIIVENISCSQCNFAPNVTGYMKRYCRILNPTVSAT